MSKHLVNSFSVNYTHMSNKHFDYTNQKILKELEWINKGFICTKWYNVNKNGTKGEFQSSNENELQKRLQELMQKVKDS